MPLRAFCSSCSFVTSVPPPGPRCCGRIGDDVVEAVCSHLVAEGWRIDSRVLATEHGDDIVASRGDARLIVEAKDAGSCKEGTKRYGSHFNLGQVKTHVAVAVLRALGVTSAGQAHAALALPDDERHRRVLAPVLPALTREAITVYLMSDELAVRIVSASGEL